MKNSTTIMMAILALGLALPLQGGWWIFGKAKGEVELQYVQINGVDFEEAEGSVAFTRDLLADGMLVIRGKARAGRDQIGAVEISLDDQTTWQQARMAGDGTFEFSWRPDTDTTYTVLVKAVTTTGKTNSVEDTRLQVRLLEQDLRSLITDALRRLIEAYQNEDGTAFMRNVSVNFSGDPIILDRAVRDDFSIFDNIQINFTLNNLAVGRKGRIMVGITYTRSLISVRTGQQLSDRGNTEFTFVQEDGMAKVWAMKFPLIFGLSDPGEIATGVVGQPANQDVIIVTEDGEAKEVSAQQAQNQADGEEGEEGDFYLENEEGWNFATGGLAPDLNFNFMDVGLLAWGPAQGVLTFAMQNGGAQDMGPGTINEFNEAPDGGYNIPEAQLPGAEGHVYALRTIDGKYALIEVVSFAGGRVRIRYKYQPSGARFF